MNSKLLGVKSCFLILLYIILTFAPLITILLSTTPDRSYAVKPDSSTGATEEEVSFEEENRPPDAHSRATGHSRSLNQSFLIELSVALGFLGMATLLLQFLITSRTSRLYRPIGIDVIYYFHHIISIVSLAFIMAHPLILLFAYSDGPAIFNFLSVPFGIKWGLTGLLFMIFLVGAAKFRKLLHVNYKIWRILHGTTAMGTFVFATLHIFMSGKYTDTPVNRWLWSGYTAMWVLFILYIRVLKPIIKYRTPYSVVSVENDLGDSLRLTIKPEGHKGFRFLPGQFAWITTAPSPFSLDDHPFSFSSSSEEHRSLEFGIKELGDFTRSLRTIQPGAKVYVDGPFGYFSIDAHPGAKGYLFFAGGIGISPFISMIRSLADRQDKRPHILFYACRDEQSMTFRDTLTELEGRLNLKVIYVLEKPDNSWQGEKGFITKEVMKRHLTGIKLRKWDAFLCGPVPMMEVVDRLLKKMEMPRKRIHMERFDFM